jgi:hypothetical protein
VGFERRDDAEQCLADLRERVARFGLDLHPEKTRLLEFGRVAAANRRARGERKPASFNFLGFTHSCATTRTGRFTVLRRTMRRRVQAKRTAVKLELQRRMHRPLPELGAYVGAVGRGHVQYYGVPLHSQPLVAFARAVTRLWWRVLNRRSQRPVPWHRMRRYVARWVPPVRICHPYPLARCGVMTQGGSRMRECRTSGSEEGVPSDGHPYSNKFEQATGSADSCRKPLEQAARVTGTRRAARRSRRSAAKSPIS